MMRAVWTEDPVTFQTRWIPAEISDMRMQPRPAVPIPVWIGGSSEAALTRAVRHDGWHGSRVSPEQAGAIVARLRRERQESEFVISVRCRWNGRDEDKSKERFAAYAAAGVQHLLVEPEDREKDGWLRSVERIAAVR